MSGVRAMIFGASLFGVLSVLTPHATALNVLAAFFASVNLTLGLWRGGAPERKIQ